MASRRVQVLADHVVAGCERAEAMAASGLACNNSRASAPERRLECECGQRCGCSRSGSAESWPLDLSPEVSRALAEGRPVVALESTIITHGMPWPRNLETARAVEAAVRAQGAVPATVAVLRGRPTVGLTDGQLETLARGGQAAARKTSRRDLPVVAALGLTGATTVSATALLAARAGIAVFATGGLGGVHRGGEDSLDISADLTELARTPIALVCAGVKSVLDIPRTLEVLETGGVPVLVLGSDRFPAFFARDSGCPAPARVESAAQAAAVVRASRGMGLGGVVLAVPVPEAEARTGEEVGAAIETALREVRARGVAGRDVTPFLLDRVRQLTGGKSLDTNVALVKNNAAVAARVATELCGLMKDRAVVESKAVARL